MPTAASDDEWEDQLLVSEPTEKASATPAGVPEITARRLNPHGAEAAEARRRRDEAIARASRASGRRRRAGNPILLALGAVSVIATAWLSLVDDTVREPTPLDLIGEWSPTHPDYAGARLAFTTESLTIGTPTGERSTHHVESLRATPEGAGVLLEISYASPDGPVSLSATLENDAARPRLVFEHPVGLVWERITSSPLP